MKTLAAILIAVLAVTGVIDNIATTNRLKKEAEAAYKSKNYKTAIKDYNLLLDSLDVDDENIRINLAHAYLMTGDTAAAQQNYGMLIRSNNPQVKSLAFQQLGVISSDKQQYKEALGLFKESLKADPDNNESRYNYELVKKLLQQQQQKQDKQKQDQNQQKNQDQQQKNQDQQQQQQNQQGEDQQNQQNQQGEQSEQNQQEQKSDQQRQEGEQKPEQSKEQNVEQGKEQSKGKKNEDDQSASPVAEKLKEMNISEEKARMILEAMRNNEMQYIQQNRRKPTQARDRSKPDW